MRRPPNLCLFQESTIDSQQPSSVLVTKDCPKDEKLVGHPTEYGMYEKALCDGDGMFDYCLSWARLWDIL